MYAVCVCLCILLTCMYTHIQMRTHRHTIIHTLCMHTQGHTISAHTHTRTHIHTYICTQAHYTCICVYSVCMCANMQSNVSSCQNLTLKVQRFCKRLSKCYIYYQADIVALKSTNSYQLLQNFLIISSFDSQSDNWYSTM